MLRCLVLIALMAVPVAGILAQTAAQPQVLPDSEIRKVLADRIDTRHEGVGIVVGVTENTGRLQGERH